MFLRSRELGEGGVVGSFNQGGDFLSPKYPIFLL